MLKRRGILTVAMLLALSSTAGAEGSHSDEAGKNLYTHYCSSCHGTSGKGDGTMASLLDVKPTDLTTLKKNSADGEFSFMGLLNSIDGRKRVKGHGAPEMPVWGELFKAPKDAPLGEQLQGAGKLLLITYYVESIQVP